MAGMYLNNGILYPNVGVLKPANSLDKVINSWLKLGVKFYVSR
jgi:hypothetical protein